MAERRGHISRRAAQCLEVAATLALALTLTGCTGSPDPVASSPGGAGTVVPTSPTTASPSPSEPSIPAPERPAAMDRDDAEGAVAAATYFISLYSYVYATGDLDQWQAISDPECVFCSSVREDQLAASSRGERTEGGAIAVVGTPTIADGAQSGTFQVDTSINQTSYRTYGASGLVIREHPEQSGQMAIAVSVAGTGVWRVTAVGTKESTQ